MQVILVAIGKAGCKTGDTLSTKATPVMYGKTDISKPYTYMAYKAKNKGDEDKISQALVQDYGRGPDREDP